MVVVEVLLVDYYCGMIKDRRVLAAAGALLLLVLVFGVLVGWLAGRGGSDSDKALAKTATVTRTVAGGKSATASPQRTGTAPAASATVASGGATSAPPPGDVEVVPTAASDAQPAPPTSNPNVTAAATQSAPTPTTAPKATATPVPTSVPTEAPPKVIEIVDGITANAGGAGQVQLTCPPDRRGVGGGFVLPALAVSSVNGTAPSNGGWQFTAYDTPGATGSSGSAMCLVASAGEPQIATQSMTVLGDTSATLLPLCPAGTTVVGGGFLFGGAGRPVPEESRMDGNGWRLSVINTTSGYSQDWTAFAVCLPGVSSTSASATVGVLAGSDNLVSAPCPAGSVATAGGFSYGGTGDGLTKVWLSRADGNGWKADARNTTSHLLFLSVYAVCTTF